MLKILLASLFAIVMLSGIAQAQSCSTWPAIYLTNGNTADASQVMANFLCAAPIFNPHFSGNVGIGTTSPDATLQVNGIAVIGSSASGAAEVVLNSGGTANAKDIEIYYASGSPSSSSTDFGVIQTVYQGHYLTNLSLNPDGGNVGINIASPSYPLHVNGTAYAAGAAGALSDIRHKKDIAPLKDGALDSVMKLRPVSFQWKAPKDDGMKGRQMGFIAQAVEKVLPSAVLTQHDADKTKGLKYNEIVAVLTKALQEQQTEINNQQNQIEILEGLHRDDKAEIDSLKGEVNALKSSKIASLK